MKNVWTILIIVLSFQYGTAQQDHKEQTLEVLQKQLVVVQEEEKEALKKQIGDINSLLNNGVIDKTEADKLKLRAAEERTRRIEERQAVLLETIANLKDRENKPKEVNGAEIFLDIDSYFNEKNNSREPVSPKDEPLPNQAQAVPQTLQVSESRKFKNPTTLDLVFAVGLNNTVKDGVTWYDLEDEVDYSFYDSRFFEIGFALKTPLAKKNGLRIKYGISYQWNKLESSGNRYFTETDGGQTILADSFRYLGDSRFVVNNLVLPVHLELGPTKVRQNDKGSYYSTRNKFKLGLGGYAGLNLNGRQWVQHSYRFRNIRFLQDRFIDGYAMNEYVYGFSAYVGIGAFSLYGKYDLNTIFENGAEDEQFVSFGLRLDL